MNFTVLQCNEDPCKRNIVLNRSVVVLHSPTAIWYISALAAKSDTYFTYIQVEYGATIKTVPLGHQGTTDPPNISILEGGGKQRKISSSSPKSVESDPSTVAPIEMVVDGPGTAYGFPALANIGDGN